MQTRNPYDPSPVPVAVFAWEVADDGGAQISPLPMGALLPNQAFTESSTPGGLTIAIGATPTDDPVWEEHNGGIRLKMT